MTRLEYKRAHQARRRQEARDRGDCIRCCCRPRVEGRAYCAECTAADRKAHDWQGEERQGRQPYESHAASWCEECQAAGFHRHKCAYGRERRVA
jgi:hypothetical protein